MVKSNFMTIECLRFVANEGVEVTVTVPHHQGIMVGGVAALALGVVWRLW